MANRVIQLHDLSTHEQPEQDYTEVYLWGSNHQGQLGLGHKYAGRTYISPKAWSFNMVITQVSCGEDHAAFVSLKGQVFTMGSNAEGRLGIGDPSVKQSPLPTLVDGLARMRCLQVACGAGHTVAVTESGEVYAWGVGEYGALGTGMREDVWSPARISMDPRGFVPVRKVSAGAKHSAFISDQGALYVCGTGETGQLGTGRRDRELVPVHVSLISEKVRDVACGAFHTLILVERGRVYATGGNTLGQLGLGNKKNTNIPIRIKEFEQEKVAKIGCGHHSAALTERGELFIWGTGVFGEILTPVKFSSSPARFKDISLGAFFGTALDEDNNVWTWGSNANGELGVESNDPKGRITHNAFFDGKRVEYIACGGSFGIGIGETIRNGRKSYARSSASPLRSHIHSTVSDIYESPIRLAGSNQRNPTRQTRKSVHNVSYEVESLETKQAKKVGHARKSSVDTNTRQVSSVVKAEKEPVLSVSANKYPRDRSSNERELNKRRDLSHGTHNTSVQGGEDPLVALLMKQKNVLEKCVKAEKQEKKILEDSLFELKKRMVDLQEGPGGFADLSGMLERQARKFDEIKSMYEEENRKRERAVRDLGEERQRNRELIENITEKENVIAILQKKVDGMDLRVRDKQFETEELRKNMVQSNGRLQQELDLKANELAKLGGLLDDFKSENSEKKDIINTLEESLNNELQDKRKLEYEIRNLNINLDMTNKKVQEANMTIQELERQLEGSIQKERNSQETIKQLHRENEDLRSVLEQNIANQRETNAQMLQEHDTYNNIIQEKEAENAELKSRLEAMEQDLIEHQEKNKKLISILSGEIEKQAEQFKKKTYDALVGPASRLAQNIVRASRETVNEEKADESSGYNTRNRATGISWNDGGNNGAISIAEVFSPSNNGGGTNLTSLAGTGPIDLEKLRKEIYENKSTFESRLEGSVKDKYAHLRKSQHFADPFNGEGTGNLTLSSENNLANEEVDCTVVIEKEDNKNLKASILRRESQDVEDARVRLSRSANKLRDILDLSDYESHVDARKSSTAMTPVRKRDSTPKRESYKGEATPSREERRLGSEQSGSKTASRVKSPSPYKVPTFGEKEKAALQAEIHETNHLQNLRDVKARLELLQRNKQALEDKMQNYENKLKIVNN